jgi:corrinoid protein of di/trimethylamine methyltransferase
MDNDEIVRELRRMVVEYDIDKAEGLANQAIGKGLDLMKCYNALIEGISEIGKGFSERTLFLPDLIAASDVVKVAMPIINAEIERRGGATQCKGKVVIGTVAGDIHTIGKDMVSTLLFASGFDVVDLGVDVSSEKFIGAVRDEKADILAMSALLTTTIAELREVIENLKEQDLRDRVKVIVGGAPVNKEFAESIGADAYGETAVEGVEIAEKLL